MKYAYSGMSFLGDPQKVGRELEKIELRTPEAIVSVARNSKTELHKCFEWDDSIAGENWRKQQARLLVNSIVSYADDEEPLPVYENVIIAAGKHEGQRAYLPRQEIMQSENYVTQVKAEIRTAIDALERKLDVYSNADKGKSGIPFTQIRQHVKKARELVTV